ncbi:transcription factor EMB1444-like isoform X2 [Prosopis cineraria]|uniref:transcription factor EMB1444-like isoform X2 n=1 Tax=Prosopis cineraria TaxID=364024 RepID=UPI0024108A88|nr:transcription factor EMB1444-like isoform X2 [Prosopis cineraria]
MEATSMMKLLKSFCDCSHWNYAVFWKLNHHFPMTLTWEDGYYCDLQTNEAVENMWTEVASSSCETIRSSEESSVRLLMTEMSRLKYILGEGAVGKIALTGDHCWILFEDILTGKFQTKLKNECLNEWLLQFASAIKTIVLVPVLPQGVLQFGSFKAVAEDLVFVANVKEKFNFFHHATADTLTLSSDENIHYWSFSALTNCPLDNSDVSSLTNTILTRELFGGNSLTINELRLNPTVPLSIPVESGSRSRKNETIPPSTGVSNDAGQVEIKSNRMEEVIGTCSPCVNNVGVFGQTSEGQFSYSHNDMAEQFGDTDTDHEECNKVDSFNFPLDSELHKALGPFTNRQTSEPGLEYLSAEDTYSASSTSISGEKELGHIRGIKFSEGHKSENLLDAVLGNLSSASGDSSSTLPTVFTASIHPQSHSEGSTLIAYNGILLDGAQQESVHVHRQPNSGSKHPSIGKKRARAGNTPRPRPRDRQLIMDRMKELRELVPDGAKCSIDNLLDRAIKHMLYLREVTDQAEKLKQFEHKEVPELKQKINGNHTGRSCAIDFGSELQVFPIVIEDLECPGHMLIEVICSEHGLFFEIAQVIRQLELTILKGVLESSSSTALARFIVEVPRGFHRMDVLCPLLHLLQTGTSSVT